MAKEKKKSTQTREKELEEQVKRALADYANLVRRVEEEKSQLVEHLKSTILIKILPVLDNLEAAYNSLGREADNGTRQGLEISIKEFKKILAEEGIEEIGDEKEFDPRLHEPVEVVSGKEDGKVIQVVQRGYRLGEKILRPAKVKVGKK